MNNPTQVTRSRFEIVQDGQTSYLEFETGDHGRLTLWHTEVPQSQRGKGIALELVTSTGAPRCAHADPAALLRTLNPVNASLGFGTIPQLSCGRLEVNLCGLKLAGWAHARVRL